MTASWKAFQDLVARIEKFSASKDAVVKSPDRRRDLVTGKLREVDASIVQRIGSATVLITVECRQHAESQDVTWIEQLATKRESIGAAATIAVSAEGFSAEALDLARRKGVITRKVTSLTDAEIEMLLTPVYQASPSMAIVAFGLGLADGQLVGPDTLSRDICERMSVEPCNAAIFCWGATGTRISLNDVFRIATHPTGTAAFDRVPRDGTAVTKRFNFQVDDGALFLDSTPPAKVRQVTMRVELRVTERLLAPDIAVLYHTQDETSAVRAEYETSDADGGVRIHVQQSGDQEPVLGIQLRDRGGALHPARLEHIRSVGPDGQQRPTRDPRSQNVRFVDPDLAT
jgi:hypothetical protein